MRAVTVTIATDLLRIACASVAPSDVLVVQLTPLATGVNRARASAQYVATFAPNWLGESAHVQLIDSRGGVVGYTLAKLAAMLARVLPANCPAVQIQIEDATQLPARWTDARIASLATKVAAADPAAIRAAAAAKLATVADWVASDRKTAVVEAAARMESCAAAIDAIRSGFPFGQGGGGEGGGGMN